MEIWNHSKSRGAKLSALLVATVLVASACGGSKGSGASADESAATKTIKVGYDGSFGLPYNGESGGKRVGFDPSLIEAIAKKASLKVKWVEIGYATMIPAIDSGRVDIAIPGGFAETPERRKQVILVDYYNGPFGFMVKSGNPSGLGDGDSVCGKKVATYSTSVTYQNGLKAASKKCTDAGKPAINVTLFSDQPSGYAAVRSGRVDGFGDGLIGMAVRAKASKGVFDAVKSDAVSASLYGFAVKKDNMALAKKLAKGFQAVIESGELKGEWRKYVSDLPDSVFLTKATINGKDF